MSNFDPHDESSRQFMRQALELAEQGRFRTAPNPCVGALLTRNGQVLACGWHTACGRPHAEVEALRDAQAKGVDPAQCTLWVTLEPCNHQGRTPPCTRAILEAGIKEVVVGCLDPNPDVAGGGVATLRQAGVTVHVGVMERECRDAIADFVVWKFDKRPFLFLKLAATLDGRIATRTGHSQWVSGPEARKRVHELRSRVQAVFVGGNTLREDDPRLTSRLGGQDAVDQVPGAQPLAVVVTSRLPDSPEAWPCLVSSRAAETVFFTGQAQAQSPAVQALNECGCRVWPLPACQEGGLDLAAGLARLHAEFGCHYVLCEGGGNLGLSLLEKGLVDEFQLFLAPKVLGDAQARPLFQGREPVTMDQAFGLRIIATEHVGEDLLLRLRPREDDVVKIGELSCSQD